MKAPCCTCVCGSGRSQTAQTQTRSLDWSRLPLLSSVTLDHDLVVIRRLRDLHSVSPDHEPSAPAVRLLRSQERVPWVSSEHVLNTLRTSCAFGSGPLVCKACHLPELIGKPSRERSSLGWVLFTAAPGGGLFLYRGFKFVWLFLAHRVRAAVRDCLYEI